MNISDYDKTINILAHKFTCRLCGDRFDIDNSKSNFPYDQYKVCMECALDEANPVQKILDILNEE